MKRWFAVLASSSLLSVGCRETTTKHCDPGDPVTDACCAHDPTFPGCPMSDAGMDAMQDGASDVSGCGVCEANQVCDEATNECVGCVTTADCEFGVCDTTQRVCRGCLSHTDCADGVCHQNTCVGCIADSDCATGVCDPIGATCVPCLDNDDCDQGVCNPGATSTDNACVACLNHEDCTEADASVCSGNTCMGCATDADCGHISGKPTCEAGVCVACSARTESTACKVGNDVFACDGATNTCSTLKVGAQFACQPCVSSSSCGAGHACVPTSYQGVDQGMHCMPLVPMTACPSPYRTARQRADIDGIDALVCVHAETLVSCDAIHQFTDDCTADASVCNAPGSVCEVADTITGAKRCTYPCGGDSDCKTGYACLQTGNAEYCGLP